MPLNPETEHLPEAMRRWCESILHFGEEVPAVGTHPLNPHYPMCAACRADPPGPGDFSDRYRTHLHAYFVAWGVPESLYYVQSAEPDPEPVAAMAPHDAMCYTLWLESRGVITPKERRWYWHLCDRARRAKE
jgi:hypothetical protein